MQSVLAVCAALVHHIVELSAGNASAVHHTHAKHHRSVNIIKKLHMSLLLRCQSVGCECNQMWFCVRCARTISPNSWRDTYSPFIILVPSITLSIIVLSTLSKNFIRHRSFVINHLCVNKIRSCTERDVRESYHRIPDAIRIHQSAFSYRELRSCSFCQTTGQFHLRCQLL